MKCSIKMEENDSKEYDKYEIKITYFLTLSALVGALFRLIISYDSQLVLTFKLFVDHDLPSVDKGQEHAHGWWAFYKLARQL